MNSLFQDYAVGHHGGYHQRTAGGQGESVAGERVGGDGGLRGRARRGRGAHADSFTGDRGDSGRLLPGRPRMVRLHGAILYSKRTCSWSV